nr:hypothetical protein [Tanacetum cinerariifolium]
EPRDEESFDPILKTPKDTDDEGNGEENLGMNVGREEGYDEEEEEDELYRDVNINQGKVAPLLMTAPTITPSTIATITTTQQVPLPPIIALSTLIKDLPNFGSLFGFDNRLRTIEANFSKFMQTNQFARAVSSIPRIVKEQVKVQVFKILPKIEQTMNEQLKAKVLTRSSNSSKTSYAVAADLSEMDLKKILIEKMEGNKEGKEPESASDPKEKATRSIGKSTQGSKSRQTSASESATAEEPMQTTFEMEEPSHPEFEIGADDQPIIQSSQHPEWFSQQKKPPTPDFDTLTPELLAGPTFEPMKGSCKSLVELKFLLEEVYKVTIDKLDWVNPEGQQYPHNLLKPLPLIPNNRGRRVIPFDHFINNDLEYLHGGASSRKYTTSVTKTKATDYGHIKWIEDLVPRKMWIQEPIGYDKHALWRVEDHQLGVESYQKKLNLTRPDTYRTDLKRKSIWRKSDKDRAVAMIQAIDKRLKTWRIIRSLERFVRGRLYEGDFRMLQRTI